MACDMRHMVGGENYLPSLCFANWEENDQWLTRSMKEGVCITALAILAQSSLRFKFLSSESLAGSINSWISNILLNFIIFL